ncbi:MAG: choice-of-anchor Q domain-containing protein [Kiritimatiellae bacterium]|nr:choice-of-anchor Q domain-containing protein [Kiritimatiellia bacterium]
MKRLIVIIIGSFFALNCPADTHYVTTNGSSINPYTTWETAGTSIIDVVNAAMTNTADRLVWVSNGTYYLTNQVSITNVLTLKSVNGHALTIVDGNNPPGKLVSNRCFFISAAAVLDGFTVQNGVGEGGGIRAYTDPIIQNCRITQNRSLNNGGGLNMTSRAILRNSIVDNNIAAARGGGLYGQDLSLINCTFVSNTCLANQGGGMRIDCPVDTTARLENVVSYFNQANGGSSSNFTFYTGAVGTGLYYIANCCIAPTSSFPGGGNRYYYTNNIQSNPQFIDKDAGNWRLQWASPCVNTGTNEDWMRNAVDLDGKTRLRYGTVDMGAYECIWGGSLYRFH